MKKLLIVFSMLAFAQVGFSQSFINGVGVCVFATGGSNFNTFITGGFTYSPRVNVSESDNSSVSIGLPLSIGLSYSSNSVSGTASASAMVNAPLVVNYNIGCGSSRVNESRFGFFAGGGFGYHLAAYADSYSNGNNADGSTTVNSYGPVGNLGIRLGVGRGSHNIEIKGSFMKGLDITKANIISGACIFNF